MHPGSVISKDSSVPASQHTDQAPPADSFLTTAGQTSQGATQLLRHLHATRVITVLPHLPSPGHFSAFAFAAESPIDSPTKRPRLKGSLKKASHPSNTAPFHTPSASVRAVSKLRHAPSGPPRLSKSQPRSGCSKPPSAAPTLTFHSCRSASQSLRTVQKTIFPPLTIAKGSRALHVPMQYNKQHTRRCRHTTATSSSTTQHVAPQFPRCSHQMQLTRRVKTRVEKINGLKFQRISPFHTQCWDLLAPRHF